MTNPAPDFFDTLATDCELSADRAQTVINAIQRSCLETGEPTYRYCQDMQELTAVVLKMKRLAKQYWDHAQLGFMKEVVQSEGFDPKV